jgi:hypothetical protein
VITSSQYSSIFRYRCTITKCKQRRRVKAHYDLSPKRRIESSCWRVGQIGYTPCHRNRCQKAGYFQAQVKGLSKASASLLGAALHQQAERAQLAKNRGGLEGIEFMIRSSRSKGLPEASTAVTQQAVSSNQLESVVRCRQFMEAWKP